MLGKKDELCPNSKKIYQFNANNELIKSWNSMSEASRILKIPVQNISKCCEGKRKTAGGYVWRYYTTIVED